METVEKWHQCQVQYVITHQQPNALHPTVFSRPFECSGNDIKGSIYLSKFKGNPFIEADKYYFSKWLEANKLSCLQTH